MLDACVLHSFWPRDILLRLAERDLFSPVWSRRILDELTRSLRDRGYTSPVASLLDRAFPEARVRTDAAALLRVPALVDPGDRHVVAAAIAGHASFIVTVNLRDFAPETLVRDLGIVVLSPDQILISILQAAPADTVDALYEQLAALRNPPAVDLANLLEIGSSHAPAFVTAVRDMLRLE